MAAHRRAACPSPAASNRPRRGNPIPAGGGWSALTDGKVGGWPPGWGRPIGEEASRDGGETAAERMTGEQRGARRVIPPRTRAPGECQAHGRPFLPVLQRHVDEMPKSTVRIAILSPTQSVTAAEVC